MYAKNLLFFTLLPSVLGAFSPAANRFMPFVTTPELPVYLQQRPTVTMGVSAAHASKAFNKDDENDQFMHSFDGLLEISGLYNLQGLIAAGSEAITGYQTPFMREKTGGDAWANQEMYFAARSSLGVYGAHLGIHLPIARGVTCGVQVPFWHMEARQRYDYPIAQNSQTISLFDAEQVRRFRRYAHQDFGLKPGDWHQQSIGDVTGYLQWARSWQYPWLLRSITFGLRAAVSAPTGIRADSAYPSAIPAGNDGHWVGSLSMLPSFELKEGLRLTVPVSVSGMLPHTASRRIATYAEPHVFSPLQGLVRIVPGATLRVMPQITVEHLIENVHCSIGYAWTKHWADAWYDKREDKTKPSFLSRETVPTALPNLTAAQQTLMVNQNKQNKKEKSAWERAYVTLDVRYEMSGSQRAYRPQLRLFCDYCVSGSHAARMSNIGAQLSWQF